MKEFFELMKKLSDKDPTPYWKFIIKQYVDSARAYHNLQHIVEGLDELKNVEMLFKSPEALNALKFAWWHHDIIYFTGNLDKNGKPVLVKDNEEKSALYACQVARELGLKEPFIQQANDFILVTKHDRAPKNFEEKTIIDLDLVIFGKPKKVFDTYNWSIRQEYSWVPEEAYKAARAGVLQSFLNRPYIYHTDFFSNMYEVEARKNLERALFNLSMS